ncbi:MAG TPA: hypothetical protein VMH91_02145 [Candidatus Paceibacterota bacterium]|nr:hypothetical protein [Candidatus Paceibacterota bacterium]
MIHDPFVSFTDLLLSIEAGIFAFWIARHAPRGTLRTLVTALFTALTGASFFGALFHAFFPLQVATSGGWYMWILTTCWLGAVAVMLYALSVHCIFGPRVLRVVWIPLLALFVVYEYCIVAVDYHYSTVIDFYAPALAIFSFYALWKALTSTSGWGVVFFGAALTAVAALAQSSTIEIGPLDHNAIYHVLQALALALLFIGFRRVMS